jgi:hypothetical protein
VDDVATRQVGSVDAVATKQSLELQIALLQTAAFIAMVVFLGAGFQYLFTHLPTLSW